MSAEWGLAFVCADTCTLRALTEQRDTGLEESLPIGVFVCKFTGLEPGNVGGNGSCDADVVSSDGGVSTLGHDCLFDEELGALTD